MIGKVFYSIQKGKILIGKRVSHKAKFVLQNYL